MKALVTGFEPFGGRDVNPSQELVEVLAADPPDGVELVTRVLPVAWSRAGDELVGAVLAAQPDVVVCFGQADGIAGVEVERFALNMDDGIDSEGEQRHGDISPYGPVAYRSTLPVDEIVAALEADGIPVAASRDAGGYLCNHVFYVLMALLEEQPGIRGGFVHVSPDAPLETLVRAARAILAATA